MPGLKQIRGAAVGLNVSTDDNPYTRGSGITGCTGRYRCGKTGVVGEAERTRVRNTVVDLAVDFREYIRGDLGTGFQIMTGSTSSRIVNVVEDQDQKSRVRVGWRVDSRRLAGHVSIVPVDEARLRQVVPHRDVLIYKCPCNAARRNLPVAIAVICDAGDIRRSE
jgi:hypothetical protein